jgi:hypothetical protein
MAASELVNPSGTLLAAQVSRTSNKWLVER